MPENISFSTTPWSLWVAHYWKAEKCRKGSPGKPIQMWDFKHPKYTCHLFSSASHDSQKSEWIYILQQPKQLWKLNEDKGNRYVNEGNNDGSNKVDSNDDESCGGKKEEAVLCIFLRCSTYCEALTRSSAFAIVSKFFEGFVCWGALWVSPHSLQSPTPDRATSKLEELCFVGPWSLDSQHVVLWLWTSAPFNPFCQD